MNSVFPELPAEVCDEAVVEFFGLVFLLVGVVVMAEVDTPSTSKTIFVTPHKALL